MPAEVVDWVHGLACRQKANPVLVFGDCYNLLDPVNAEEEDDEDDSFHPGEDDDASSIHSNSDNDSDYDPEHNPYVLDEGVDLPNDSDDDGDDPDDSDDDGDNPDDSDDDGDDFADDNNDNDNGGDAVKKIEVGVDEAGDQSGYDMTDPEQQPEPAPLQAAEEPEIEGDIDIDNPGDIADPGVNEPIEDQGVDNVNPAKSAGKPAQSLEEEMDQKYGTRTSTYNMRPRTTQNYSHLFMSRGLDDIEGGLTTPQMSIKRGLKLFGNDGLKAIKVEMLQLHSRDAIEPKRATELSNAEKQKALAYLMFLKRKRSGKIKGRRCTDG